MASEPRAPRVMAARSTTSRADLAALAERVTRVETIAEHLQETLSRIDVNLDKMQQKIDALGNSMAQGIGGLRVGAVVGQVAAGIVGFLAARFWPGGK